MALKIKLFEELVTETKVWHPHPDDQFWMTGSEGTLSKHGWKMDHSEDSGPEAGAVFTHPKHPGHEITLAGTGFQHFGPSTKVSGQKHFGSGEISKLEPHLQKFHNTKLSEAILDAPTGPMHQLLTDRGWELQKIHDMDTNHHYTKKYGSKTHSIYTANHGNWTGWTHVANPKKGTAGEGANHEDLAKHLDVVDSYHSK